MSPVLPFDIIALIIDIVMENKDTILLVKELALVSHSFHQICSKHRFATVELHDLDQEYRVAPSMKAFVKLIRSSPDVVKYIRRLKYNFQPMRLSPSHSSFNDDHLLSSILPNLLRTISHLNCLTITAYNQNWNTMDSSLTSAFFYLMHLPTVNHIDLRYIQDVPLSCFTSSPSPNLHRLDILYLDGSNRLEEDGSPEILVQSGMMPKIREFHTLASPLVTTKLLHAKRQDGQPAFNFVDLRRLYICLADEWNIRHLLENANLLEELHLSIFCGQSLVRLHDILSPTSSARTLKVLHFTVSLFDKSLRLNQRFAGLCEGLEAMAGDNMLEVLSFDIDVDLHDTEDSVGCEVQRVEKVLVRPGWSALRQVFFKLKIPGRALHCGRNSARMCKALQSVPDKYLSHLSKLESVAFNYSVSRSMY
jgi:hypothetical protein